ncbi:MAG: Hsp20/alpha crystallin family protein [Acidobacteriota bacterium]|nr:Hsp20/alpha crystallin family protein [Acidobacteriota bacterium]
MSSLNRWTPTTSYLTAREPLFRLIDNIFSTGNSDASGEDIGKGTWMPPVDIQETEAGYRLQAELPGLTKDDVAITLENNVLRLSGERKFQKDANKENYHRVERVYGAFSRSFALPHQVSSEGVEASFQNGVLTISVPKAEQARPRKIAIS